MVDEFNTVISFCFFIRITFAWPLGVLQPDTKQESILLLYLCALASWCEINTQCLNEENYKMLLASLRFSCIPCLVYL